MEVNNLYYSQSTSGFYSKDINGDNIPQDAVELSEEEYRALLEGQSKGKRIVSDLNGLPSLADSPLPTESQVKKKYALGIQHHLDSAAQFAGYDDIKTAVTYAEEPSVAKFQNDGKAFRKWRSLVWAYTYEQLDLVIAGQRTKPTVEEFIAELPLLEPVV